MVSRKPGKRGPVKRKPVKRKPVTPGPVKQGPVMPGPAAPWLVTPGPVTATPGPAAPGLVKQGPATPGPVTPGPIKQGPATPGPATAGPAAPGPIKQGLLKKIKRRLSWKLAGPALGLMASAAAIFTFVGWNPFASKPPTPVASASVVSRLLNDSNKIQVDPLIRSFTSQTENNCVTTTIHGLPQTAMKCWIVLSQFYDSSGQFQAAINAIQRAEDIDVRIADPYYAMGGLYHDLLLLDLAEQKRYKIVNEQRLLIVVQPDSTSKVLSGLIGGQYQRGDVLPLIGPNVPPTDEIVTDQGEIAQTQNQIDAINSGASTLTLTPNQVLSFMTLLDSVYPNDPTVKDEFIKITPVLFKYIKEHPDQFPGMLTQFLP